MQHAFVTHAQAFAAEGRALLALRYGVHRDAVARDGAAFAETLTARAAQSRQQAMAEVDAFLLRHPDQPEATADGLLRQAVLRAELADERVAAARDSFAQAQATWRPESGTPEPTEPEVDYGPALEPLRQLLVRFSDARERDEAQYLMGTLLDEVGDAAGAAASYRAMLAEAPQGRHAAEVWTRLGELAFAADRLDEAAAAYRQVQAFADSPMLDKALYKLAWTHFRRADPVRAPAAYQASVDTFVQLLDLSSTRGGGRPGELDAEAVHYLALCYADERWGGIGRLDAYLARLGPRPYAGAIWAALGGVYAEQTRYADGARALAKALAAAPLAAEAPARAARVVALWERLREPAAAASAREQLIAQYGAESAWAAAHRRDTALMAATEATLREARLTVARMAHASAQADRRAGHEVAARAGYAEAAAAYRRYLRASPAGAEAYGLAFDRAECLYYAGLFEPASAQYVAVRDANVAHERREDAALSVVLATQDAIDLGARTGRVAPLQVRLAADRPEGAVPAPKVVPTLVASLLDATDTFARLAPRSAQAPRLLYRAGEALFALDHLAEARQRFERVLAEYPGSEVAGYAVNLGIETHLIARDYAAVAAFADAQLAGTGVKDAALRGRLESFRAGARFQIAASHAAAGDHEAAARLYLAVADAQPHGSYADRAINNAAVAFERARRFDSATRAYGRLAHDYPRSPLAPGALFRVGLDAEHLFDFPRAIASYRALAGRYPAAPERADAVYNAALAQENTQEFAAAAAGYADYCRQFPRRADVIEVCLRSAQALEKTGHWPRTAAAYQQFVDRFAATPAAREQVLAAMLRAAAAHGRAHAPAAAERLFRQVVQRVAQAGRPPKLAPLAAEAQFALAEATRATFAAIALTGDSRHQKAALTQKAAALRRAESDYAAVVAQRQVTWTLAALLRTGQLYQAFAESLLAAPCPPDVIRAGRGAGASAQEICEEYHVLLEEKAGSIEDRAVAALEGTIKHARELQVANVWTRQALVALNTLRRAKWPLQKEPRAYFEAVALAPAAPWGAVVRPAASPPAVPAVPAAPPGPKQAAAARSGAGEGAAALGRSGPGAQAAVSLPPAAAGATVPLAPPRRAG